MKSTSALKSILNISTPMLVLLQFVTLGFYPAYLVYKHADQLNEELGSSWVNKHFMIALMALSIVNVICLLADIGGGFGFLAGALWIVFAFNSRKALVAYAAREFAYELRMSGVACFFFTIFYVNYVINDLPVRIAAQPVRGVAV